MRAIGIVGAMVLLGSAGVALALDAAAAETVLEGRLSGVRSCLSSAPEDAHGGLTITLYLSGTGTVRQTEITRRGPGLSTEVAHCVADALESATFEGATRADTVVVRFLVAERGGEGERVRIRDVTIGEAASSGTRSTP